MKIEVIGLLESLGDHMKSARTRRDAAISAARAAYERLERRQPGADLYHVADDGAASTYSREAEMAHRELLTLERMHNAIQGLLAREMQEPTTVRREPGLDNTALPVRARSAEF